MKDELGKNNMVKQIFMRETNRIEFKRELTRELDIEREVVAFLNYREGGTLYIGINDDGKPVGVKDIDGDMLKIKDRIRNNIAPSPMGLFDVTVEHIGDVPVIKVFVASGSEKPYYKTKYGLSERGCYIRVGTAAEPMTPSQIEDLYAHRVRVSLKNIPSPRQDLSFQQMLIYYQEKGMRLNDQYLRTLELLTPDGRMNYVAYLLADENGNSIKLARYAGKDRVDLISNMEFGYCSLLKATDRLLDRLKIENRIKTKIGYPFREDKPQWNELAIRELVINAIVHNDYTNEVPPKFELFSDHLEITSTGTLPINMSKEDFFSGVSYPKNKELMRVFRDVEVVEALGSGMSRVMQVYDRSNFIFLDNFLRVSIPYDWIEQENTTTESTTESILSAIRNNPSITQRELAEIVGITTDGVYYVMKQLREQGIIRRIGGRANGTWEIIQQ